MELNIVILHRGIDDSRLSKSTIFVDLLRRGWCFLRKGQMNKVPQTEEDWREQVESLDLNLNFLESVAKGIRERSCYIKAGEVRNRYEEGDRLIGLPPYSTGEITLEVTIQRFKPDNMLPAEYQKKLEQSILSGAI